MRLIFLKSVSARLAGIILVLSGATLLILTEVNRRAVERILLDQAQMQAAASTAAVVDGLDAMIGSVERLVKYVARDLEGRVLDAAVAEKIARNVVVDNPNIYGCSLAFEPAALADPDARLGVYVHRSASPGRFVARDLAASDRTYWTGDDYRAILARAQTVWSEPYFDRGGTDRNVVRVSTPVFRMVGEDRQPVGVVSAFIDLDWLRRLANVHELADTNFTIIFSRSGRIIIHPKPVYAIAETVESLAEKDNIPELLKIYQGIAARRQGSVRYTESFPTRVVHAKYKPAKVAGWGVIVGYEEAEFLKSQRQFRLIAAAFLGSTLLLLAGIVILVTRLALRPLGRLAAAADQIALRNLDVEIAPPLRDDEIGLLAGSFRAMRDALKAQLLERRWADQSLAHQLRYNQLIIDSISDLVFVLTKALNVSRINPAVTRATGFNAVDLIKSPLSRVVRLTAPAGADFLLLALRERRTVCDHPAIVTGADGAETTMLLSLVPLCDDGRVVGGVVTLRPAPVRP